jgi:hypothetical protein
MRNLLNPKWLLLVTVGPLLLLAMLCYGEFSVIHSLLPPASVALWKSFGWSLGWLGLGPRAGGKPLVCASGAGELWLVCGPLHLPRR